MDRSKTSDRFQERYQQLIVRKRKEVLKELNRELNEWVNQSSEIKSLIGSDMGDLSTLSLSSDLSVSLVSRYSNMLKQLDQALERIEEGTYGLCEECGRKIDDRRLEILPSTLYCTPCQQSIEKEGSGRSN
jgi:DnaK suppressor protein